MAFIRPTLQQIVDRMESDMISKVENSASFLRRSFYKIMIRVLAGAIHLIYGFLDYTKNQLFASTAETTYLEIHGSEFGLARKSGSLASGNAIATGIPGVTIPNGALLQSSSGNVYTITANAILDISGIASVEIEANGIGESYNEIGGTVLSFSTPIVGVNSSVTVDANGITNGSDDEEDQPYRNRILERKRKPPSGGAEYDYIQWALEYPGVTRAWTIPLYQGVGTVGLAFVRDDDSGSIIPSQTEMEAVKNYIIEHTDPETNATVGIPVTAENGLFMIELTPLTINFTVKVYPNTASVRDSVTSRLTNLVKINGMVGGSITISQMYEAIVSAVGESKSLIVSPTSDQVTSTTQIHILGDITFLDY